MARNRPSTPRFGLQATVALVACVLVHASPALGQVIHEEFKLRPRGARQDDVFGAVDIDDSRVVLGSRWASGNPRVQPVHLFNASTGSDIGTLVGEDTEPGDAFGRAVGISDGIAVVGAWEDDDRGPYSGSAYLFDTSSGVQLSKLLPDYQADADHFGGSVAISHGLVAIGAHRDNDKGIEAGAVYVFDVSTGSRVTKLFASDAADGDFFGSSVAMDDEILAVGAIRSGVAGAVYVFDTATGVQLSRIVPSDGGSGDSFGASVAVHRGLIAVGAPLNDTAGFNLGSAYVFDIANGSQLARFLPDADGYTDFGRSIGIGVAGIVVGAAQDDYNGSGSGIAYLYRTNGEAVAKLVPSDGAAEDGFGGSVAIDGELVAVGAPGNDDNGTNSGCGYLFVTPCIADFNEDDVVNELDVSSFLAAWTSGELRADFNQDEILDTRDIIEFLNVWVRGC